MMAKPRKRVKLGDILQLKVGEQFAYLHYLGKHPIYGDAVRVSRPQSQPWSSGQHDPFKTSYVTFYPATVAAAQGLVEIVGHQAAPAVPQQLRRAGARASDGTIKTWIIEDGSKDVVKTSLSTNERQLPIAAICNHALLVQRIAGGWDPRRESGARESLSMDPEATQAVSDESSAETCHTIAHFLYVPTRQDAETIASALRQRGFRTESDKDAIGEDWLVLARHEAIPTLELISATRQTMEELVAPFRGEYDGWEVDIGSQGEMH